MNKVFIAGHLGGDPDSRFTPSGQKVTSFSVATNVREGKEDVTIWWRVSVWGDRFDKMLTFFKKGSSIIVHGSIRPPRSYVDKEGRTQISLEITADSLEFSPFGKTDRSGEQGAGQPQNKPAQSQSQRQGGFGEQTFGGGSQSNHGQAKPQPQMAEEEEDPLPF
jgi:single-strand DNA-binding protein